MTAQQSIDLPGWMAEQLSQASPDLLRAMLQTFAEALMSADADAVCGAGYGQLYPDRRNTRKVHEEPPVPRISCRVSNTNTHAARTRTGAARREKRRQS